MDSFTVPPAPELRRIYEPIEKEIEALNLYLHDEFHSVEPFIGELLQHIAQFRGKQIRPACLFLAARFWGDATADHIKCAAVVELIHTATLIHDDLLDDSTLRRRVETVNKRWGERAAVLLGDFIYSRGFSISTEVPGVSRMLADTTHTICEGELLQIGSTFEIEMTEERYFEIIRKKTAVLYGMACQVGAMLSGGDPTEQGVFQEVGQNLGMAFQIGDDTLDLAGHETIVGKSLGTDLLKGKMTLPVIRLRDSLSGSQLEEYRWMLEHPGEAGVHDRVLELLNDHEIIAEVNRAAAGFVENAVSLLDCLPPSPLRENYEELARFILDRHL